MWIKSLAVLVMATMLGGLIGWSSSARNPSSPPPVQYRAAELPAPRPKWRIEDFLTVAREKSLQAKQSGFNPLSEKLADWTDEEITAALNASLTDPDFALPLGAAHGLDGLLLGEWMMRDFDAAIAWFDRLESVSVKSRLASSLSYRWPVDKAEQGLAFVLANRGLFPETTAWSILGKALQGCAKQGPQAVENFLQILRIEKIAHSPGSLPVFPDHFDFPTLVNGEEFQQLWESGKANPLIVAWHAQDRDKVFDWLVENHGAKSLTAIASLADGDILGNMKWLGGKFEALEASQRGEFLEEIGLSWAIYPTNLVAFAEGIDDPGVLAETRALGVQSVFAGQTHQVMPLLETVEDPAQRIALLENARPSALFIRRPDLRKFDAANESFLLLALAGLFAGIFVGRQMAGANKVWQLTDNELQKSARHVAASRPSAATPVENHDLASLLRWQLGRASGGREITGQLERMSSSAIRDLMTGLTAAQQKNSADQQADIREILQAAAKELFHLEGEQAVQWANSLDSAAGRAMILEQMIIAAATKSPEFAKSWIARFHAEYGKGMGNPFAVAAITGATGRGAEDLIRLKELYGDELSSHHLPRGPFADGFDFHLLISKLPYDSGIGQAVEYWAAKDRDAAWSGVQEAIHADGKSAAHYFGSFFTGIATIEGDQNAAKWAVSKLDELPPELRDRAVSSLLTNQLTQNSAFAAVIAELPRDADRVALAASLVSPFGNEQAALGALQTLGSESSQVEALIASAKVYSRAAADAERPDSAKIRDYFATTMDQLQLSPASRESVNTVLRTPQDPYPD